LSLKAGDTDRNRSFALDVVKKSRWFTKHLEKKASKALLKLVEGALKTVQKQVESVQNTAKKVSTAAKVAQKVRNLKNKVRVYFYSAFALVLPTSHLLSSTSPFISPVCSVSDTACARCCAGAGQTQILKPPNTVRPLNSVLLSSVIANS
jgi:hypothetical protein